MSELANFNQKLNCKNCTEDVFSLHTVAVRCAECPEQPVLCPDCFASRAVLGQHRPEHSYSLLDNGGYAVMGGGAGDWSAREHIRLLEYVEQYGYGNWEEVVRRVAQDAKESAAAPFKGAIAVSGGAALGGPVRSADETREEFVSRFIHGPIGRHTWHEDNRGRARDHTSRSTPLSPHSLAASQGPSGLSLTESIMLGYMSKRDDYEVEHDNDAERLVAHLQHGIGSAAAAVPAAAATAAVAAEEEEEEVELALKVALVDMYRVTLKERERRRRVAREYQLVTQYFKENPVSGERRSGSQKSKKKDKVDLSERLKVFAELQGVTAHQSFMAGLGKERELKARVKDLLRFRKNGITRLKEGHDYEAQRLRRIKRKNELRRKQQESANSSSGSGAALGLGAGGVDAAAVVGSPLSIKSEDLSNGGSPMPALSFGAGGAMSPAAAAIKEEKTLNIAHLPGHELLSSNERKLCTSLRLIPAHYISYKTCLLTNHLQKKKGQTPKPLNPEGLDKNNRKVIFQFLMRAGWITAY